MVSLSADVNRVESWAVEFLVNHTKLVQVAADGGGNISVLAYDKQVATPFRGQGHCTIVAGWGRGHEGTPVRKSTRLLYSCCWLQVQRVTKATPQLSDDTLSDDTLSDDTLSDDTLSDDTLSDDTHMALISLADYSRCGSHGQYKAMGLTHTVSPSLMQDPDSWDGHKLLQRCVAHTDAWLTSHFPLTPTPY